MTRLDRGTVTFGTHVSAQLAFEHVALIGFGIALDAVCQVDRLFFLRHLASNFIETGFFVANRSVLNLLPNRKLKMHDRSFRVGLLAAGRRYQLDADA
jgi:hypothetical protein